MKDLPFKKRSFFITSFMLALTLLGCGFDSSNAKGNKDGFGYNHDASGKDDPERIKDLNKTREWRAFKTFWKSLDLIEPGQLVDTSLYAYGPYIKSEGEDYNKKHVLVNDLEKNIDTLCIQLQSLVEKKLLDTLEIKLIKETCHARVEYIYYGNRSMMMRMIPAPGQVEKERSITALELRIDLLQKLTKKNKIDSIELKQALANIQTEIKKYSILDIIARRHYGQYYDGYYDRGESGKDTLSVLDRTQLEFEISYEKFMKNYRPEKADENSKQLYENYVRTKNELSAFYLIYPGYRELIHDLIVNE